MELYRQGIRLCFTNMSIAYDININLKAYTLDIS